MTRTLGVIGVPSSAGAYAPGQERAPAALRAAGLVGRLEAEGLAVVDHGDAPVWRWRPDRTNPYAQNLGAVAACAADTAERVAGVLAAGQFALVLGGDCTVGVGTVAGHLPAGGRLGLVYLDVHGDLNIPDSVPDGALDWMGVAHMLAEPGAAPELTEVGSRTPLLDDEQIVLLAHDARHSTPHELAAIERRALALVPREQVAEDPRAAARAALAALGHCDRVAIHFDVDCIDFTDAPLSENTGRNVGLSQDDAFLALAELLRDARVGALTVTELNPEHGSEDGATVADFAARLAATFGGRP